MSEKVCLLDESSDSDSSESKDVFKINKSYASAYDVWRNNEEMQKLKALSKDDSTSSSSESEDENPEIELEFFRTLSLLKAKDPRIYDPNAVFYKDEEIQKKTKVKKPKPMYMKDYERKLVLERNGQLSDDEEEDHMLAKVPTYSEEQENLKRSFKEALGESDNEADDDLLQIRKKTKSEIESEETDYLLWLKGEEKELPEETKKDLATWRDFWNDPNLDENEKFIRDYFLNKRYLDKNAEEIPTYEEITCDVTNLSDDEKVVQNQEMFEHKYNFRFEEPDSEFVKRYPRTVEDSLRRADTRRKMKREEYAERKKGEKEQKREELKRLKALKRKEIEEKFLKLKEISGHDEINLNEEDIESDFDPEKHDQKMKELFNEDYYKVEENEMPKFPYDEELDDEKWDLWNGQDCADNENTEDNQNEKSVGKDNDNETVTINPKEEFIKEMCEGAQTRKKREKKKSFFAKTIAKPKPIYDAEGKSFEEYLDEYYKMDYEDIIGDMPVRFKYRTVLPNDFGLTVDEILTANDRDLNRWCSVKKTHQYRNDEEELYDVQAFKKKAANVNLKKKVLSSVYLKNDDNEGQQQNVANKKKKKKSKKKKLGVQTSIAADLNDKTTDMSKNENYELDEKEVKFSEQVNCDLSANADDSSVTNNQCSAEKKNSNTEIDCRTITKELDDHEYHILNLNTKSETASENQSNQKKKKRKKKKKKQASRNLDNHQQKDLEEASVKQNVNSPKIDFLGAVADKHNRTFPSKTSSKLKNGGKSFGFKGVSNDNFNEKCLTQKKFKRVEDKRLELSDNRLAAYGINPKKFKSKIIYSQK